MNEPEPNPIDRLLGGEGKTPKELHDALSRVSPENVMIADVTDKDNAAFIILNALNEKISEGGWDQEALVLTYNSAGDVRLDDHTGFTASIMKPLLPPIPLTIHPCPAMKVWLTLKGPVDDWAVVVVHEAFVHSEELKARYAELCKSFGRPASYDEMAAVGIPTPAEDPNHDEIRAYMMVTRDRKVFSMTVSRATGDVSTFEHDLDDDSGGKIDGNLVDGILDLMGMV